MNYSNQSVLMQFLTMCAFGIVFGIFIFAVVDWFADSPFGNWIWYAFFEKENKQ